MKRLLALSLTAVVAASSVARAYPIARERELGDRFDLEATPHLPLLSDPEVFVYVNRLGAELVRRLDPPQPFDYRFRIVRDSQLNAFAVPGGSVWVHSGLLSRVSSDAELAGVLGHEIAHVHAHHIVRQQTKSQLASVAALAGMLLSAIQPALGAAAIGASATAQLKYQREFEQEADYMGVRLMERAGFHPRAMASFMKKIGEERRTNPIELPPYMLSHPLTDERITNLEAVTREVAAELDEPRPSRELRRVQAIVAATTGDPKRVAGRYATAASEGNAEALALEGLVRLHQGEAEEAIALLEKAKAGGAADLERDLGLAALRVGRFDDAIRWLAGRVEADPGDVVSRYHLGLARLQAGRYEEARGDLERVVEAQPLFPDARETLGQSFGRAGDAGRGFYHLGRAAELRGELEKAVASYERAKEALAPGSVEAVDAERRREALEELVSQRTMREAP